MPPLLPVLLPLILAAIGASLVLSGLLPPDLPEVRAPIARFEDVTGVSGITFTYQTGSRLAKESPTTLGGGVVCFDYDRDGHTDLFFVNRAPWPWSDDDPDLPSGRCRLFRNDGAGGFRDVSRSAGLDPSVLGMSASAADYDNDGFPDLFLTCVGLNRLYRNLGDGRFEDVTDAAGVGGEPNTWSTGAAWIDIDEDGLLDLVVGHYARWLEEVGLRMAFVVANVGRSYGTPTGFAGMFPSVYRNLGNGRFGPVRDGTGLREVDVETGLPRSKVIAVVPVDANGDEHLDLLFTYHTRGGTLFINQGGGTFRRSTIHTDERREGASTGLAGSPVSMGQPPGRDERFLALAALSRPRNLPDDGRRVDLGIRGGVAFLDYDFDGRIDLFNGNGRAEWDTQRFENGRDFESRPEVLWNRGNGWTPAPSGEGSASWNEPMTARGVASADLDNDGDLDVVVTEFGRPARVLRNNQHAGLPWLAVDLVGTRGVRDAFGARVEVHTPRRVLVQTLTPAIGLFAQSSESLFFGLSDDARVQKIVVRWPGGTHSEFPVEGINRRLLLVEP